MKVRMHEMQRTVMAKYNGAVKMEEETNRLKENYKVAIGKQNQMRRTIYEHEDKQEVLDRDTKEITRRLYEKEEYLRELSLFKPGNSIEEAEKMDKKLLETKQDMIECTLRAVDSKINALNSELHHLKLE